MAISAFANADNISFGVYAVTYPKASFEERAVCPVGQNFLCLSARVKDFNPYKLMAISAFANADNISFVASKEIIEKKRRFG